MDARVVVRRRLAANGLAGPARATPERVVRSLRAVQSQDVQPAAWSTAQRLHGGTEAGVAQARGDGRLLRTHVLRTTWHDVAADDLRWLLRLTGPRPGADGRRPARARPDDDVRATARRAVEAALPGRQLTRAQRGAVLAQAGLALTGLALTGRARTWRGGRGRTVRADRVTVHVAPRTPVDSPVAREPDESHRLEERPMASSHSPADDIVYNLVSVQYHALQAAQSYDSYVADAEGHDDVQAFFKQCAEQDAERARTCHQLLGQLTGSGGLSAGS